MKGIIFTGERKLELRDFPDPTPGPGEVVLEIKASGMCGSDLKFYRAAPGGGSASLGLGGAGKVVIAGHEPCGVVVAVGDGVNEKQARIGMRAMQHHYRGCAACAQCATGWMQLCVEGVAEVYGVTANGAHTRYLKCPARTLVPLPDELSYSTGAATQLASSLGARVIALDTSPRRLQRAGELGAQVLINPGNGDDVLAAIKACTGGLGADLSLDASSAPSARRQAVQCVRTWGKACFVGEGGEVNLDVSNDLLRRQVTLLGSWTFSTVGQAECAKFVAERKIDIDQLFTHHWRLDQAEEAYQVFDRQTSGKGVFLM